MQWKVSYRHYNVLVDICFWIVLAGYTRSGLVLSGVPPHLLLADIRAVNLVIGIPVMVAHLGLIVLIVFSRLRDEYAERLWQQAAAAIVKIVPLFPLLWVAGFYFLVDRNGGMDWLRANPGEYLLPEHARFPNPNGSIGVHQFEGLNFAVVKLASYFPLIFAGLYKWKRWRDERT